MEIKDKKVKTETIFATDVFTLNIHNLANMNPMQGNEDFLALKHSIAEIGQQDPIVLFKGKIVDGRNRQKALKELFNETKDSRYKFINYKKLPTTLSLDELEEIILGKETRRHKTPVQKAIQALNYYTAKSKLGENINMREPAKKFGVSTSAVSKILSLRKVAGEVVVQKLFTGDSVRISKSKKDGTIYSLDSKSPDAIRKHYENLLKDSKTKVDSLDPQEMAYIQLEVTRLLDVLSYDGLSYLSSTIVGKRDLSKTSYDKEVIEKELGLISKMADKYADKEKRDRIVQSLTKYIKEGRYEFEDYEIQSQPDIVIKEIKELLKT